MSIDYNAVTYIAVPISKTELLDDTPELICCDNYHKYSNKFISKKCKICDKEIKWRGGPGISQKYKQYLIDNGMTIDEEYCLSPGNEDVLGAKSPRFTPRLFGIAENTSFDAQEDCLGFGLQISYTSRYNSNSEPNEITLHQINEYADIVRKAAKQIGFVVTEPSIFTQMLWW